MATTPKTTTTAAPKAKKALVAPLQRINDQMRRAAGSRKFSAEELDKLAQLASALEVLVGVRGS